MPPNEFSGRFQSYLRNTKWVANLEELVGVCQGFHLGLTMMMRHPEWGQAAKIEFDEATSGEIANRIIDAMSELLPIEIESET